MKLCLLCSDEISRSSIITQATQELEQVLSYEWANEAVVEEGSTLIKNVLLCGNMSLNGYHIPPSAFGNEENVKALYGNKHVMLNHSESDFNYHNRDIEALAGYVINPRKSDGKPYGDIETKGTPKGEMLRNLASEKIPNVGLSHVAAYEWGQDDETGERFVETILEVVTVDAVIRPATTKNFHENNNNTKPGEKESTMAKEHFELESERLTTINSELESKLTVSEDALSESLQTIEDTEGKVKTLTEENAQLVAKVDAFESAELAITKRASVMEAIKTAGLDAADKIAVSDTFIESLLVLSEDSAVQATIKDRCTILEASGKHTADNSGRKPDEKPGTEKFDVSKEFENNLFEGGLV